MEKKAIKLEMPPELHEQIKECADHYGASVRGTILRYIRNGIEVDQESFRRERFRARQEGGTSG